MLIKIHRSEHFHSSLYIDLLESIAGSSYSMITYVNNHTSFEFKVPERALSARITGGHINGGDELIVSTNYDCAPADVVTALMPEAFLAVDSAPDYVKISFEIHTTKAGITKLLLAHPDKLDICKVSPIRNNNLGGIKFYIEKYSVHVAIQPRELPEFRDEFPQPDQPYTILMTSGIDDYTTMRNMADDFVTCLNPSLLS